MDIRQVVDSPDDLEPAIPPPPGVVPNFEHPPNWQWATILAMVLYIVTTTIFFIMRMYTRIKVHSKLWWDDYTMALGWVGLLAVSSMVFVTLKFGNATNEWNISKADMTRLNQVFSKFEILARLGIFFTKTSILLLYLRYFCPPRTNRTAIWWWTWAVIIFNLLYCIALILTITLQCVGKHKAPGESCVNSWAVLIGASTTNVITDIIMLAIPISAVWNLRLARARKIGLWIMFSVAGLAVAASVARLAYQIPQAKSPNRTILITYVGILALAEHAIGIIVGCMPLLPSLYSFIRRRNTEGGQSDSEDRYPVSSLQRRIRGKYNDTTLLATGNSDFRDIETTQQGSSQNGKFTSIETVKLATLDEHREPRPPQEARLQTERNPRQPAVEQTVRVDIN